MFLKLPVKEHEYSTCQDTISVIYGKEQSNMVKSNPCYTMKLLEQRHNHSINYFYVNYINKTLKKQKTVHWLITIKDQGFYDNEQHLEKQYNTEYIQKQYPSLLQYYRYYGQKPVIFHKDLFNLLFSYAQKQKIIEYNRLKQILNLDQSTESCEHKRKINVAITKNYSQILLNLSDDTKIKNQQSYLFKELNKYLHHIFGQQQVPSLQRIDQKYHFFTKNTNKLKIPNTNYLQKRKNSQNKDRKLHKADIKPLTLKTNQLKRVSCESPLHYGKCRSQQKSLNETANKFNRKLKKRPRRQKFASCQSIETQQNIQLNDMKSTGRNKFNIHTKQNSTNLSVFKVDSQIKNAIDEIKKRINLQKKQVKNKRNNEPYIPNKKYRVK